MLSDLVQTDPGCFSASAAASVGDVSKRGISASASVFYNARNPSYEQFVLLSKDLANMIKHSTQYRSLVSKGLCPGRWLSIQAAEHFSGLPLNWTNPSPGTVNVESVRRHFPDGEAGYQLKTLVTFHFFWSTSGLPLSMLVAVRFQDFSPSFFSP